MALTFMLVDKSGHMLGELQDVAAEELQPPVQHPALVVVLSEGTARMG